MEERQEGGRREETQKLPQEHRLSVGAIPVPLELWKHFLLVTFLVEPKSHTRSNVMNAWMAPGGCLIHNLKAHSYHGRGEKGVRML